MNDIAICCKEVRFCRMLALELSALGYSVTCNPRGGSYRLWIVDLDTVSLPANHPERGYLGITRSPDMLDEETRSACIRIISPPFVTEQFCKDIAALLAHEPSSLHTAPLPPRLQHTPLGYELDGEPLALTAAEERVLTALCERRGETVSRAELCNILENDSNEKLADVYICLLRRKLEAGGHPRLIFTVRGVGYRLQHE